MSARLVFLFTTFPVATETFLQREVRALRAAGYRVETWSLWGGTAAWEGCRVRRLGWGGIVRSFGAALLWAVRRPRAFHRVLRLILSAPFRGLTNLLETWLGLSAGLTWSREVAGDKAMVIHGVWATSPATAAWVMHELTGRPFSFGAHAYDLFEHGGDALLPAKVATAAWMRSSTARGCAALVQAGADPSLVHHVRRGLPEMPLDRPPRLRQREMQILAVGRLVEKMGFGSLLAACAQIDPATTPWRLTILGQGPLRASLTAQVSRLGLDERVTMAGYRPFSEVVAAFGSADVFVFSGVVAASGDRAGLPNAVAEAMVYGVPVVATPVGAVDEAITDGVTGLLAREPAEMAEALGRIWHDPALADALAQRARVWAETHYDARRNMAELAQLLVAQGKE